MLVFLRSAIELVLKNFRKSPLPIKSVTYAQKIFKRSEKINWKNLERRYLHF